MVIKCHVSSFLTSDGRLLLTWTRNIGNNQSASSNYHFPAFMTVTRSRRTCSQQVFEAWSSFHSSSEVEIPKDMGHFPPPSIHHRGSNHQRLPRLNHQPSLIHQNPSITDKNAILQIFQRRIGDEESVRASYFDSMHTGWSAFFSRSPLMEEWMSGKGREEDLLVCPKGTVAMSGSRLKILEISGSILMTPT